MTDQELRDAVGQATAAASDALGRPPRPGETERFLPGPVLEELKKRADSGDLGDLEDVLVPCGC